MKELRSIKKGPAALLLKYPIRPVAQAPAAPIPSQNQRSQTQRFFDRCETKLSRIVSDPKEIDGLTTMPEVAFMGRSNVGKSSLLNALLYPQARDKTNVVNKEYARVANHPGYTKTLNFFTCGRQLRVVDMPGYGYGSREAQGELIKSYLQYQHSLKRVFLLVSSKEGITELDEMVIDMFGEYGISWQLVYTKLDKLITKTVKVEESSAVKGPSQAQSFLNKLSKKTEKKSPQFMLSEKDSKAMSELVAGGLPLVENYPTVYEQAIGTSSTKTLGYLGVPELRCAIFQACGLMRRD
ncbi:MIOREX complex component 8 [Trichomonascus vanleenenianus]|uniref:translation initiation/elongation factor MRX8 n=1 Tax=Trichomonascus vanleenenianus TaxID=2268995 RepID=UPI003ECB7E1B